MLFFNDMDRTFLKLLSSNNGLELFAKNIQEAFNNSHEYRKIEDHKGLVEYLKAIRDGDDGSEEAFDKYVNVVDIREKVTEKNCNNCMSSGIWPSKEPCMSCISSGEMRPNWKPKEDTSEQAKKSINDVFGVDGIKHISDRVDSIQANVLEYGNNCVSKLIGLNDKLNDVLYIEFDKRFQCLNTRIDMLEFILKDIQKSLETIEEGVSNTEENVFNAIFNKNPKLNGLDINEGPTEKELEEAHEHLKKMTKDEHITLTSKKEPIAKKSLYGLKIGDVVKYKCGNGALYTIVGFNERSKWYRLKSHSTSGYFVYVPGSRLEKVEED